MLRKAIARFAPLRRRKPPCLGFPSFPGFRRRASGSGLFPLSSPASGCRLSRFPPPCLGVRSFPAFIARIGLPSFPVPAGVRRVPVFSRFHRPHRIASGRTGSYRARCCEPPLSRARENRSSGNRIARSRGYFRTSLVCGGPLRRCFGGAMSYRISLYYRRRGRAR